MNYNIVKSNYQRGLWPIAMVIMAFNKNVITAEEFKEITGNDIDEVSEPESETDSIKPVVAPQSASAVDVFNQLSNETEADNSEKYILNQGATKYHKQDCDDVPTNAFRAPLSLVSIKRDCPDAKPCSKCNPPALG